MIENRPRPADEGLVVVNLAATIALACNTIALTIERGGVHDGATAMMVGASAVTAALAARTPAERNPK